MAKTLPAITFDWDHADMLPALCVLRGDRYVWEGVVCSPMSDIISGMGWNGRKWTDAHVPRHNGNPMLFITDGAGKYREAMTRRLLGKALPRQTHKPEPWC